MDEYEVKRRNKNWWKGGGGGEERRGRKKKGHVWEKKEYGIFEKFEKKRHSWGGNGETRIFLKYRFNRQKGLVLALGGGGGKFLGD